MKNVDVRQAEALLASGGVDLVDVREPDEWASGHLPGARHVPLDTLRANPGAGLPRDNVLFVCARGGRSQSAAQIAETHGLKEVYSPDGGTIGWAALGLWRIAGAFDVPFAALLTAQVRRPPPSCVVKAPANWSALTAGSLRAPASPLVTRVGSSSTSCGSRRTRVKMQRPTRPVLERTWW